LKRRIGAHDVAVGHQQPGRGEIDIIGAPGVVRHEAYVRGVRLQPPDHIGRPSSRDQSVRHAKPSCEFLDQIYDRPGDGAVLLFVDNGGVPAGMPHSLNGVPTRIIEGDAWAYRGLLNDKETHQLLQTVAEPQLMYELLPGQMQKARAVQAAHVAELLKQPGVLGVGISASVDAPGEAALLIYLKHGTSIESIPAEIDGVRTRLRETGPFMAGKSDNEPAPSCRVSGVGEAKKAESAAGAAIPWEL